MCLDQEAFKLGNHARACVALEGGQGNGSKQFVRLDMLPLKFWQRTVVTCSIVQAHRCQENNTI